MVSDLGAPAAGEGSGKSVLLCLDGNFDTSRGAFEWALNSLIQDGDEVHIVMVKPPSGLDKGDRR